jgi:predicted HTH transcriptional regulator
MSQKVKEEQVHFLQTIKPNLVSSASPYSKEMVKETMNEPQKIPDIKLKELILRIENIEKMLETDTGDEGVRKTKVKEQILSLLQQNKKLTASHLSNLINLSRTRCSEYFRELMKEGKTEAVIINRQKYYKIVGK